MRNVSFQSPTRPINITIRWAEVVFTKKIAWSFCQLAVSLFQKHFRVLSSTQLELMFIET